MRKVMFLIENSAVPDRKRKVKKAGPEFPASEGVAGRSRQNREEARLFHELFEPYLKEILAQFSLTE